MNQLKYNERIYRIKNKQEAWEGLTWVLPLLNINPMKALKALGMYFDAECIYMPDDRIYGISDAMDIIEEKYIKSASDKNAYIFSLTSSRLSLAQSRRLIPIVIVLTSRFSCSTILFVSLTSKMFIIIV